MGAEQGVLGRAVGEVVGVVGAVAAVVAAVDAGEAAGERVAGRGLASERVHRGGALEGGGDEAEAFLVLFDVLRDGVQVVADFADHHGLERGV